MNNLIAFFPGQGAQQVGMLADIAKEFPLVESTFSEASDLLGFNLWQLVQSGSQENLNKTFNTQPALLSASIAIWRILKSETDVLVKAAAGHSLGEYSALVAANALDFQDAVRLVRKRGELMEEAVPEGKGGMAAVLGLDNDAIQEVCSKASELGVVEAVNYNAPGQVVIAGDAIALEQAIVYAKDAGAKRALALAVSGPFHSSLMKPAAEKLQQDLVAINWRTPEFAVIHNVGNSSATVEEIPKRLLEQLYHPVDWVNAVHAIASEGNEAIEVGPGKVVSGLNKRIDKRITMSSSSSLDSLLSLISHLQQ